MVGPVPKCLQSENIITVKDDKHPLRPASLLVALKPGASDEEKREFEAYMNDGLNGRLFFPEIKKPYYRWNGDVVDGLSGGVDINEDGGPGSGNFGHKGIPGQVGGSAPGGSGVSSGGIFETNEYGRKVVSSKAKDKIQEKIGEYKKQYDYVGVRRQSHPFELGKMEHRSHEWVNGEDTGEELEGVSCVGPKGIDCIDDYYGNNLAIIGGYTAEYGEDPGEIVIGDAEVLEIISSENADSVGAGSDAKIKKLRRNAAKLLAMLRTDEDDEGRWITTENHHKVHINAEGEPDIGNEHVLEAMKSGGKGSGEPGGVKSVSKKLAGMGKITKKTGEALFADIGNDKTAEYGDQLQAMKTVLNEMESGAKIKFPESFNDDDGRPLVLTKEKDEYSGKSEWTCGVGKDKSVFGSLDEIADYMLGVYGDGDKCDIVSAGTGDTWKNRAVKMAAMESGTRFSPEEMEAKMEELWDDAGYGEAHSRGKEANRTSEQYRFFGKYMRGVQYGTESHDAFRFYNHHGDGLINGMARGSTPRKMRYQREWREKQEKTRDCIEKMTQAIDDNPLEESAVVYRGVKTKNALTKLLGMDLPEEADIASLYDDGDFVNSLVGRTFSDAGFTSTSIDPDFPKRGGFDTACSMTIYCPAGTRGTYFGDALIYTDEYEFLLQRGTQFVITGARIEYDYVFGSKKLHLDVAVIGQEPQEIPELKTLYEPNKAVVEAIKTGNEIPAAKLSEMYGGVSMDTISELCELRNTEGLEKTGTARDILSEEMFAGNLTAQEAGELESYVSSRDEIENNIDDFGLPGALDIEVLADEETVAGVQADYPGMEKRFIDRIAKLRAKAEEVQERSEAERKRHPEDDRWRRLARVAEDYRKEETYAVRAYQQSKKRKGKK